MREKVRLQFDFDDEDGTEKCRYCKSMEEFHYRQSYGVKHTPHCAVIRLDDLKDSLERSET